MTAGITALGMSEDFYNKRELLVVRGETKNRRLPGRVRPSSTAGNTTGGTMRNHRWSPTVRGVAWMVRCVAVSLLVAVVAGPTFAGTITLDNSKIPPSPGTLKRLKNSRANAPSS